MKQFQAYFNAGLAVILILVIISLALPVLRAQAAHPNVAPSAAPAADPAILACDTSRTVQVSGAAVINVTPDRALIQLGVQSNGTTPDQVEAFNSAAIGKIIKAMRASGVDAKDIATDLYMIEPIYENYDSLFIKGYRINNVVAVTLRDVSRISKIIASALNAGANQVVNVDLYTSELRKYRDQARELAIKAAVEKASALAGASGAKTRCVINITENSWSSYNGWWFGHSQNQMTQNVMQNAAPTDGAGPSGEAESISLGQISIRAEVGVTYSLE